MDSTHPAVSITLEDVRRQIQDGALSSGAIDSDMFDAWYKGARDEARLQVIEWLESRNRAFTGTGPEYAQDARARFGLPDQDA